MKDEMYFSVFKGSTVEADQVHDYLKQNNIGSLVRNHIQENLSAGWMISGADYAAEVFVSQEDRKQAEALVLNMFHEGLSNEPIVEVEDKGKNTEKVRTKPKAS